MPIDPRQVTACGILCFRNNPETGAREFLLMQHDWRWDLPKGHLDDGETEHACALRELEEETGIASDSITLDDGFRYVATRDVSPPYLNGETIRKAYIFFAGTLHDVQTVRISEEHVGYIWQPWQPPHHISAFLIDEILEAYARYESKQSG